MWSNLFENTPLTAGNLINAFKRMQDMVDQPIAIQPDVLIMPRSVLLDWLRLQVAEAQRDVDRALRCIARAVTSGHYQKRQRQYKHGVAQRRHEQKIVARRHLPGYMGALDRAQAALNEELKKGPM